MVTETQTQTAKLRGSGTLLRRWRHTWLRPTEPLLCQAPTLQALKVPKSQEHWTTALPGLSMQAHQAPLQACQTTAPPGPHPSGPLAPAMQVCKAPAPQAHQTTALLGIIPQACWASALQTHQDSCRAARLPPHRPTRPLPIGPLACHPTKLLSASPQGCHPLASHPVHQASALQTCQAPTWLVPQAATRPPPATGGLQHHQLLALNLPR
jgi:hypothetical protein